MLKSVKQVEVKSLTLTGTDTDELKRLCEILNNEAQSIIDKDLSKTSEVQNCVTFCRKVLAEFK